MTSSRRITDPLRRACLATVLLAAIVISGCSSTTEPDPPIDKPDPTTPDYWVIGYHPHWLDDLWAGYDLSSVNQIIYFDIGVGADGRFTTRNGWPGDWSGLIQRVRSSGGGVLPTLSLFDSAAFESLFADSASATLLTEIEQLLAEVDVDGLHIDFEIFEPVQPAARQGFVEFMRDLRAVLDKSEKKLYLSAFALAIDWSDAYDEAGIALHVDYLVVQGYDLHWAGDAQAGPVAGLEGWGNLNWRNVLQRYLNMGVPREKIVMGVPYYGYEWPTVSEEIGSATRGPGRFTTYAPVPLTFTANPPPAALEQAALHGLQRDPVSGSPYYVFQDSTGWNQGWFEDQESLRAKYEFVKSEGLAGVAIWTLGYGDESLNDVLKQAFPAAALAARFE
ncbi:MAG: glycosyl hydrolase family 18 protein [Rhodothermales bacterium]